MAIVESEITNYLKIPMPGENSDPFIDQFREYTRVIELSIFYRKIMSNLILSGGGARTWDAGSSILSWTSDWQIPVFHWGKLINVVYGPDNVNTALTIPNGSALVVDIPLSMNANVNRNFRISSQLDIDQNNEWVAGWNNNGVLSLKGIGELS